MNVDQFQKLLEPITDFVTDKPVDTTLADRINSQFPPDSDIFNAIESACHQAISDGWMCSQGGQGRRFGRIIEPSQQTGMLSVDVVDLENIVGPHHCHPNGEICMVMPITEGAQFDNMDRGWCVFAPGSSHRPTVTNGEALVLYMLPDGEIEFTGQ